MNKYELSTHPDVGSLADRQASLHLNDQDFCRRVGFSLAASSWGKIKAGTWSGNCDNALVAVQPVTTSQPRPSWMGTPFFFLISPWPWTP